MSRDPSPHGAGQRPALFHGTLPPSKQAPAQQEGPREQGEGLPGGKAGRRGDRTCIFLLCGASPSPNPGSPSFLSPHCRVPWGRSGLQDETPPAPATTLPRGTAGPTAGDGCLRPMGTTKGSGTGPHVRPQSHTPPTPCAPSPSASVWGPRPAQHLSNPILVSWARLANDHSPDSLKQHTCSPRSWRPGTPRSASGATAPREALGQIPLPVPPSLWRLPASLSLGAVAPVPASLRSHRASYPSSRTAHFTRRPPAAVPLGPGRRPQPQASN